MPKTRYTDLFIGGAWQRSTAGVEDVINPASEGVIGHAPLGGIADAEQALAAARHAFDEGPWPQAARKERAERMQALLDAVLRRREQALALMQLEMGFTRMQCEFQFSLAVTQVRKFVELTAIDPMKSLPPLLTAQPGGPTALGSAVVTRDPIGVVVAITPYNSGFLLGLMKAVPAIGSGNTVIVKPSPFTPLQTMLIAEILADLDLPAGVFNVVTGGADVGELLGSDPRVDMVSFTGSEAVGSRVMAQAAPTLKKVHLELGGKSPLIVRHDADLERAVAAGLFGFAFQAGQGCSMTTRMLVDNRIRPAFVEALAAALAGCKIGDPADADTFTGPLIREAARVRTEDFCRRALDEGASLVAGGKRPAHLTKGFYFEPTIFDNVDNLSHLAQREVFGPIAAIIGYVTDDQAIRLANQSDYGLGGGIISRDAGTAFAMALRMRTGMIQINNGPGGFHPDMPFGGFKRSGLGREWGEEGFNEYSEIKSIGFPVG